MTCEQQWTCREACRAAGAMSKIEQQLAEWRAKRDAARQAGGKPLAPLNNVSRLNPPVARSTGLKGERARSPAGCENERAPGQTPATAEPGAAQPRYLTATRSSQQRGVPAPAASVARPDDASSQSPQVHTLCCMVRRHSEMLASIEQQACTTGV